MKSDRHLEARGPGWAVSLLIALVIAITAAPLLVAPAVGSATVPTRIEGLLKSVSGTLWLVDNTRVEVRPDTGIDERRGAAEPGAWVSVWGDKAEDRLIARVVHVLLPKGAPPPPVQFSGVLTKLTSTMAVVSETQVHITDQTSIPVAPPRFALVRVTGARANNSVVAQEIKVLALDANTVPVMIEGEVEQVTDSTIVVDGHTVTLRAELTVRPQYGEWVQVRALAGDDGVLIAETLRVIDRSLNARVDGYVVAIDGLGEDHQTWMVVTFDGDRVENHHVLVAPDTYIDEDRASIQPYTEAIIEGSQTGSDAIVADTIRLDRPAPAEEVGALSKGIGGDLWRLNGRPVYFASTDSKGQASSVRAAARSGTVERLGAVVVSGARLRSGILIANSVRPATSVDLARAGVSAFATASSSASWVGPISVVQQVNTAAAPTMLLGPDRTTHLVYESNGFIYYMARREGEQWAPAQRLARGAAPAVVLDAIGNLHVAYENTFLGNSDIFHVATIKGVWTLPGLVSATTGNSKDPALAADETGRVYVAWMDNTAGSWGIHTGQWDGVYWTNYPVPNARGGSPSLAVLPGGNLFLAWQDRVPTPSDTWGTFNIYSSEQIGGQWSLPVNVSDNATYSPSAQSLGVTVVTAPDGNAHLAWIDDYQQPRYDFGRGLYWPAPVNLGPRQTYANGLSMQLGPENTLRVAWDDRSAPLLTAAPIGAQNWPAAEPLPGVPGATYGTSLALSGNGMAVAWLQEASETRTIYEAHYGIRGPMLKNWMPMMVNN